MKSAARQWKWMPAILILIVLVVLSIAHAEPQRFALLLRQSQPSWILAIIALQITTYACLVNVWTLALRRVAGRQAGRLTTTTTTAGVTSTRIPSFASLLKIAIAELFTDQAVPSGGAAGTVLVVSALARRGVSQPATGAAIGVSLFGFYAAQFVAVFAAAALFFIRRRQDSGGMPDDDSVLLVSSLLALTAAIAIPLVTIAVLYFGIGRMPGPLRRIRSLNTLRDVVRVAPTDVIFDPALLIRSSIWRLVILLLDGVTLAVSLKAIGYAIPLQDACAVFVIASAASSLSFLPGGLGTFEAVAVALLVTLGTPVEAAAPATFLMRGFTFWLPMIPGILFARREVTNSDASSAPSTQTVRP